MRIRIASYIILLASTVQASVIAERSGGTLGFLLGNDPEGVSWTQTGSYSNVSISAFLSNSGATGTGSGTVYLTDSIGAGTTATINEIAHTTVSGIARAPSTAVGLFSGLTLGPGTYYLITASNLGGNGLAWNAYNSFTQTTAPGVVINPEETGPVGLVEAAYPPASVFNPGQEGLEFQVTGDLTAVVPEPTTLWLAAAALFLGLVQHKTKRQR